MGSVAGKPGPDCKVLHERVLKFACVATLVFAFLEFVSGKLAHSLALIADAAHLLTDAGALGLAFFASWISTQPTTRRMSYGFYRVEILAALANGVGLVTMAVFVMIEALQRFSAPPPVRSVLMLGIGSLGFFFNLLIAGFLRRFVKQSVNIRSAFYHVLADLLGSVGVVVGALIIWKTGWLYADPLVSLGIAVLIIGGAWQILRDVVVVLLEGTPARVDMGRLESRLLSLEGVQEICDLHVWTISSGKEALSAHLGMSPNSDPTSLLKKVNEVVSREFGIHHTTIQLEETREKPHKPLKNHRAQEF